MLWDSVARNGRRFELSGLPRRAGTARPRVPREIEENATIEAGGGLLGAVPPFRQYGRKSRQNGARIWV